MQNYINNDDGRAKCPVANARRSTALPYNTSINHFPFMTLPPTKNQNFPWWSSLRRLLLAATLYSLASAVPRPSLPPLFSSPTSPLAPSLTDHYSLRTPPNPFPWFLMQDGVVPVIDRRGPGPRTRIPPWLLYTMILGRNGSMGLPFSWGRRTGRETTPMAESRLLRQRIIFCLSLILRCLWSCPFSFVVPCSVTGILSTMALAEVSFRYTLIIVLV